MNTSVTKKIKKAMGYDSSIPEHKRMLKSLKKQYDSLSSKDKLELVNNLQIIMNKNG